MSITQIVRRVRTGMSGKRATNRRLSIDVLEAAKHLNINISQVCDNYLREVVRGEQQRKWREDHADFIFAYDALFVGCAERSTGRLGQQDGGSNAQSKHFPTVKLSTRLAPVFTIEGEKALLETPKMGLVPCAIGWHGSERRGRLSLRLQHLLGSILSGSGAEHDGGQQSIA